MAVTLEMISYDILSWRVCRSFASRSAFWDTDVTSVKHVMMWYRQAISCIDFELKFRFCMRIV